MNNALLLWHEQCPFWHEQGPFTLTWTIPFYSDINNIPLLSHEQCPFTLPWTKTIYYDMNNAPLLWHEQGPFTLKWTRFFCFDIRYFYSVMNKTLLLWSVSSSYTLVRTMLFYFDMNKIPLLWHVHHVPFTLTCTSCPLYFDMHIMSPLLWHVHHVPFTLTCTSCPLYVDLHIMSPLLLVWTRPSSIDMNTTLSLWHDQYHCTLTWPKFFYAYMDNKAFYYAPIPPERGRAHIIAIPFSVCI